MRHHAKAPALALARLVLVSGRPVHLVPPRREYPDQYAGGLGPVEVLPAVACLGTFHSAALDPARDPVAYRSRLTVVWFQSTPRLPSGCDAEPALRNLDWPVLARDAPGPVRTVVR
ncbi:hypothetical protein [Streptomyces luteogriseus]|uniref:hypothetical protein n=1 Tax=Streptomyces luteogriseus TaxID=68233 RepID=UPI0037ACBDBF